MAVTGRCGGLAGQVLEPSDVLGAGTAGEGAGGRRSAEPARPSSSSTTFLFTDVEGSTRLWELDQEGMRGRVDHP